MVLGNLDFIFGIDDFIEAMKDLGFAEANKKQRIRSQIEHRCNTIRQMNYEYYLRKVKNL